MTKFTINGKLKELDVDPSKPLLWAIREALGLTGTKFGCGMAQCGACTIHLNGVATRSCVTPLSVAEGQNVTTIEGIAEEGNLHPVQEAWIEEQVPQCGYCQSGQVMSAVALLNENPNPTEEEIEDAMSGNICRCGMYSRIKRGIQKASGRISNDKIAEL